MKVLWRSDPPKARLLGSALCVLIGHHKPKRAVEMWNRTWRRWDPINDETNIAVCDRCGRQLSGWTLIVR